MTAHWPFARRNAPLRPMPGPGRRRAALIAGLLVLQAVCAVFFIGDVVTDLRVEGPSLHLMFEGAVAVALAVGLVFGAIEMQRTLDYARRAETAVAAASGAFADVMDAAFRGWGLTPAEADVALLTLKGVGTAEIAAARSASQGTVRAQLARVYAKAGVSNRGEFVSLFVEALVEGDLQQAATEPPRTAAG